MKFRTEYFPVKSSLTLSPDHPIVASGSCFSQNIILKMEESGWKAYNPTSTLYNPASIMHALRMLLNDETGVAEFEDTLFSHDGIWHSAMFDSSFSSKERQDCVEEFKNRASKLKETLQNSQCLMITFGTSICYYNKADLTTAVGNCHKLPSDNFFRRRLSIDEIVEIWDKFASELRGRYPELEIIFTVSPVRHLKDGFEGNAMSKAVLHLAIEQLCSNHGYCHYFPSYEIMTDDLRDYRFYSSDLLHPSSAGIDYIWEKFKETYLDESGLSLLKELEKKKRAQNHRPLKGALGKPLH